MTKFYHPSIKGQFPDGIDLPDTQIDPMVWLNAMPYHEPSFRFDWPTQRWVFVCWLAMPSKLEVNFGPEDPMAYRCDLDKPRRGE